MIFKPILLVLSAILLLFSADPALAKKRKSTSTNTTPSAAGGDASILSKYRSCKEANRAGIQDVPVTPGYTPPGWNHSADRDNDGIACERRKR
jgi:Excalibur calcium-binding domain